MKDNEFYIKGGNEKNLYGKSWIPAGNPKAVVVILHDLNDHINRYDYISRFLTHNDIATIGIDQNGHGKSSGKRGHIKGYNLILSNIHQLMITTRRRFIDLPIFLYGHGMGGNIAINYTLRHKSKELTGVILSSPLLQFQNIPSDLNKFLAKTLGNIFPSISFDIDIDPMELSHDPERGLDYLNDPLNHGKISVRLYRDMLKAGNWIIENAATLNYPILIMHGNEDSISSHDFSEILAKKISRNVDLKIWDGLRHDLHHERLKNTIMQYILSWINTIIPSHRLN